MGKIYFVGTPLGNMGDISKRAIEVLESADIIACEDTRNTLKLLNLLGIKNQLISYHKFNESKRSEFLIEKINAGLTVAIVSDAGNPGICDPGQILIKECITNGINFEIISGPSAFLIALLYSGMSTERFSFLGFIPRKNKDRNMLIEDIKNRADTLIFYESPHRIKESLIFLKDSLGNRKISISRELTKYYEETFRGTIEESIEYFVQREPKGEFVIVVEGKTKEEIQREMEIRWNDLTIEKHLILYIEDGYSKKEAISLVAKDRKIPKSEVYKHSINM